VTEQRERWEKLQTKINAAVAEWRLEHPDATLTEIETVVDSRLAEVRRQMVEIASLGAYAPILRCAIPAGRSSGALKCRAAWDSLMLTR
jgi:hypothetical protein